MARDLYAEVSAKIIAELEAGTVPWVKPWRATAGGNMPCNAVTNRPYSGCNLVLLWMVGQRYAVNRWLTFNQAKELGGSVKKGEHGQHIVFVKHNVWEDAEGNEKHGSMMRAYVVFNVEQCENLPARVYARAETPDRNPDARDQVADEFVEATGATIRENGGDRACYRPGVDAIDMPAFRDFKNADNFYATLFHELGHWTGASHRCNREFGARFGDSRYAAEELVAELTAAFLCAEFGFDGELQHASYIASWIKLLQSDKRAFFTAASAAQKAADYLRGKALADVAEAA